MVMYRQCNNNETLDLVVLPWELCKHSDLEDATVMETYPSGRMCTVYLPCICELLFTISYHLTLRSDIDNSRS